MADDHPTNLGILEAAIEQEEGCALLVPDGLAAVHAIESDPKGFDAVVTDLEMPALDGLEAIRRIRALPGCHNLPILACSAGMRAVKRQAALHAGATDFLSKPFDLEDLVSALVRHGKPPHPEPSAAPAPTPTPPHPATWSGAQAPPLASLPDIEGIDAQDAARRFSGMPQAFLHGLGRFHAEFGRLEDFLKRDVQEGDRTGVLRRLHGLAGAASMLGAAGVATAAAEMDQRLRREASMPPWEDFLPLMDDLNRILRAICRQADG